MRTMGRSNVFFASSQKIIHLGSEKHEGEPSLRFYRYETERKIGRTAGKFVFLQVRNENWWDQNHVSHHATFSVLLFIAKHVVFFASSQREFYENQNKQREQSRTTFS